MFVIETQYFNLDHIYNSGQAPRWIKLKEGKYVIPHRDKALKIEQQRDKYDWTKYRLIMSCSEEDFYNIWFEYFDLRTDYAKENMNVKKLGGKFRIVANRSNGMHILNQDTFETYVLSKLIEKLGYKEAANEINRIAEVYGIKHVQSMREAGKITWYEWPTTELIIDKFKELKYPNKVDKWLNKLCEEIVYKYYAYTYPGNWNDICKLYRGCKDVFPLIGVKEILAKNFDCEPEEFADWYLDETENKGLVYMHILYHILNKPKEEVTWD